MSLMITIMFLFGMLNSIRVNIAYIYLMELVPSNSQTYTTSALFIFECFITVFSVIYFWKISLHWVWLASIGYVFNFIAVVLGFFLPESPRYLIATGKID